jgi:2-oxo-3-hexenedioate decarboxylase
MTDIERIAAEMLAAQDDVRQIATFASGTPGFDIAAAYAAAALMHRQRTAQGATAVGRKIGFTNPDMWDAYGVRQPIWSHVYDRTVSFLSDGSAHCNLGRFTEPKIEPEIVLHLKSAPGKATDPAEVLACIDWIAPGFEIVQSHFPGWKFAAPDAVVDNSLHAHLFVGDRVPATALGKTLLADQSSFRVRLLREAVECEEGGGANVLGGPVQALAHLIATLAAQPDAPPLRAGELITTGSLTRAWPVHPGETWSTRITGIGLPGLSVTFDATAS